MGTGGKSSECVFAEEQAMARGDMFSNLNVDEDFALADRRQKGSVLRSVAMVSALLLGVVATAAATSVLTIRATMPVTSQSRDFEELDGMMVVKPPPGECATHKEDCLPPGAAQSLATIVLRARMARASA